MSVELIIQNGETVYIPAVEDSITWETERKGSPGKLEFTVKYDDTLKIAEGNAVRLRVNDKDVFYGFIFTMEHDKNNMMSITAYDQIRYLKNKDTYVFESRTASDVVRILGKDFLLNLGTIEDTGYVIPSLTQDNVTLMDMILAALDETLLARGELYVLFDDFGKLSLKSPLSMQYNVLICEDTAENLNYSTSIDEDTYNKIKLARNNEETGARDIYIAQDSNHMNQWGVLQFYDTLEQGENGPAKANSLLELYNTPIKTLSVEGAFGDIRVRAGCLVIVQLDWGAVKLSNWMLVEKCTHTFSNNQHKMDLTLGGAGYSGSET